MDPDHRDQRAAALLADRADDATGPDPLVGLVIRMEANGESGPSTRGAGISASPLRQASVFDGIAALIHWIG